MADSKAVQNSDSTKPTYPFATTMAVGYSFLMAATAFLALAVWVSREGLMAKPPHLSWKFAVVFSVGMWAFALLQFGLLYRFKQRDFWPQTGKEWMQRVGPVFPVFVVTPLLGLMSIRDVAIGLTAGAMLLCTAVGIIPTLLCVGDWLKQRGQRLEETIMLRSVEKTQLPKSVRSYFDSHTDELNRMGFEHIDDYRLKERSPMYARFFLNRERDILAEICHVRIALIPVRAVCFVSLTADGCYLESSNARLGKKRQTRRFELQVLPGISVREVYQRHETRLRELDGGCPRTLNVDELESVVHYGNKQLYDLLCADGVVGSNPYADFDESLLIANIVKPGKTDTDIFETTMEPEMTANI